MDMTLSTPTSTSSVINALKWRHNGRDGLSNHQLHHCLLNRLFRRVAHAPGMPETVPSHRVQRKPLVINPGMHHGACIKHVPWCMSGSLTRGGEENQPGILGACATRNFAYLVRGPRTNTLAAASFLCETVQSFAERLATVFQISIKTRIIIKRPYRVIETESGENAVANCDLIL